MPLIAISPYARQGIFYGHEQQDFTSFLATIEANWNLPPVGIRDANVGSLLYLFDFNQSPRQPLILPTNVLATYPVASCTICGYGPTAVAFHAAVGLNLPQAEDIGGCVPTNDEGDPCD